MLIAIATSFFVLVAPTIAKTSWVGLTHNELIAAIQPGRMLNSGNFAGQRYWLRFYSNKVVKGEATRIRDVGMVHDDGAWQIAGNAFCIYWLTREAGLLGQKAQCYSIERNGGEYRFADDKIPLTLK